MIIFAWILCTLYIALSKWSDAMLKKKNAYRIDTSPDNICQAEAAEPYNCDLPSRGVYHTLVRHKQGLRACSSSVNMVCRQ